MGCSMKKLLNTVGLKGVEGELSCGSGGLDCRNYLDTTEELKLSVLHLFA